MKKSKAEQLLEDINSIRAEETAAPSFETQVECIETINIVKKGAPTGIAKGIGAPMPMTSEYKSGIMVSSQSGTGHILRRF